jgi:hypothetical protein
MLATARAKYQYAARQADELSLAPGDLVTITGALSNAEGGAREVKSQVC